MSLKQQNVCKVDSALCVHDNFQKSNRQTKPTYIEGSCENVHGIMVYYQVDVYTLITVIGEILIRSTSHLNHWL